MMYILEKSSSGPTQVPLESKLFSERKLFIEGSIDSESAFDFMKKIMYLNLENNKPISVYINSTGGEINSGLLMYDVIQSSKAPIQMLCTGKAYSMAAVLFASAPKRYMLPNSELMIHQPLLGGQVSGNASSIQSISDSLLETKEKMNRILAKHTNNPISKIDDATRFDHYFTPEQSIDFGLCDKILTFDQMMEV